MAKRATFSTAPAMQGRIKASADKYGGKALCARCQITYEVPNGYEAKCPLCDAQQQVMQMREALVQSQNKNDVLTNEVNKLRAQVDLVMAMRDSLDLVDGGDLVFLKSVMYRYRHDKSIMLRVTYGDPVNSGRPGVRNGIKTQRKVAAPNGFLAATNAGDQEVHACTSIGGMAIAAYFAEGLRTSGPVSTMQNLARAMNQHLSGAT